jgi:hypothetical protein
MVREGSSCGRAGRPENPLGPLIRSSKRMVRKATFITRVFPIWITFPSRRLPK